MTSYYDGARAEEARLMGGFSSPPPRPIGGPSLADMLKALEMSDEIGMARAEAEALRLRIRQALFGAERFFDDATEADLYEDAEIIEEDEDW